MSEQLQVALSGRTALVNVHWQNDIAGGNGAFAPFFWESIVRSGATQKTVELVADARASGMLVIWAKAEFRPGYPELPLNNGLNEAIKSSNALIHGSHGAEFIDEFTPLDNELVVGHPGTSAFRDTPLDAVLRMNHIETILFTGVATNVTVEGTARDAVNLGYRAVIVSDACAAATDKAHEATLQTFELLGLTATSAQIRDFLPITQS